MEYWDNEHFELLADTVLEGLESAVPVAIGVLAVILAIRLAVRILKSLEW